MSIPFFQAQDAVGSVIRSTDSGNVETRSGPLQSEPSEWNYVGGSTQMGCSKMDGL